MFILIIDIFGLVSVKYYFDAFQLYNTVALIVLFFIYMLLSKFQFFLKLLPQTLLLFYIIIVFIYLYIYHFTFLHFLYLSQFGGDHCFLLIEYSVEISFLSRSSGKLTHLLLTINILLGTQF